MSPGTKADFYLGFLRNAAGRFQPEAAEARESLGACARCGAPSPSEVCAFCRLVERAGGTHPENGDEGGSRPVELGRTHSSRKATTT
jgi:tRNA(Ile)-lysidine synthase TilS/MesJ